MADDVASDVVDELDDVEDDVLDADCEERDRFDEPDVFATGSVLVVGEPVETETVAADWIGTVRLGPKLAVDDVVVVDTTVLAVPQPPAITPAHPPAIRIPTHLRTVLRNRSAVR